MRITSVLFQTLMSGVALACLGCADAQDAGTRPAPQPPAPIAERLPQDETIYFLLPDRFENGNRDNDRGGIEGGPLDHGFDPTHTGFYQGGDIEGLIQRLDYIQALGATAVWVAPIFRNKPVQGADPWISAGYHGYWITDFLDVDPHFGTREDFARLVEEAHARGMKVYMDIITNHTADVISYRECHDPDYQGDDRPEQGCPYRSLADYPWTTRGDLDGEPINDGFLGDDRRHQTAENFAQLTRPDYAYTPYVPVGEEEVKNPAWLNDLRYYHNRGETTFEGENSLYGDFAGLDDLMTEDPFVVQGFIDIYRQWITDFRVDGFRVDTTKHVNIEFWQAFAPAMIEHAHSLGIEHFHVFGEVYEFDPGQLARFTREGRIPSVLDFAFQGAVRGWLAEGQPARSMQHFFDEDHAYAEGPDTAAILPTFLGNHDMGRFATFLREANPEISEEELFARLRLAHATMMFARGVPTLYSGDEQGFISDGNDQGAREPLFPSQVASYNDNDLIGTDATTADENFDTSHPLFQAIAAMAAARQSVTALRRGRQITRHSDREGGLFAFSRIDAVNGEEVLVVLNGDTTERNLNMLVDGASRDWTSIMGDCAPAASTATSYPVTVGALDFVVCRSQWRED